MKIDQDSKKKKSVEEFEGNERISFSEFDVKVEWFRMEERHICISLLIWEMLTPRKC